MNDPTGSRGSSTSCEARWFGTGSTDSIAGGRSVSENSAPRCSADSGVAGAGLTTIGQPAAIAGPILCATRFSGKLNGEIPSTGPRGKRRTSAMRPSADSSVSSRWSVPENRLASSAAQRNVETARRTSTLAHAIGLPDSAVMSSAHVSASSSRRRRTCSSASARTWAGRAAASGATPAAAATAASTWPAVAQDVAPTGESS